MAAAVFDPCDPRAWEADGIVLLAASVTGTSVRVRVRVDPGSAFFADHFPGAPVLPAIAQLTLCARAARAFAAPGAPVAGVSGVRLRHVVRPGDELDLEVAAPTDSGLQRFEVRRGDTLVTSGALRLGRSRD